MTYADIPFPDLKALPAYLIHNPYERRPLQEPPQPEPAEIEEVERVVENENDKSSTHFSVVSNILFSCDDPERTAFFVPLMILLVVHAMFLLYLHVYSPEQPPTGSWDSLRSSRFYDVDDLKSVIV
ncbi:unnamed protein product [Orchesella dallaii]|uniref:Uncharacterized protein n=1 Tax=Orchesella dallaii TaxID=48710 RepID=A0ABP1R702_9HEXA